MGGNGARSRTAARAGAGGAGAAGAAGGAGVVIGPGVRPGLGAARAAATTPQQPQPQQPPTQAGVTQAGRTSWQQYQNMTVPEVSRYINGLKRNVQMDPAGFLPDADTQRVVYDLGLNDKPQIVTDAAFNAVKGPVYYRGVTKLTDRNGTLLMSAQGVANQTMYGDFTRIGGGVAGDGFYFSDSRTTANSYAGQAHSLRDGAIMRMKLDMTKARPVTLSALQTQFKAEHSAVQNSFRNMKDVAGWSTGYLSAYALYKGYNVITRPEAGHVIPLDRSCMIISDNVTHRV